MMVQTFDLSAEPPADKLLTLAAALDKCTILFQHDGVVSFYKLDAATVEWLQALAERLYQDANGDS